jgi:hypothetical protein
VSINQESWPFSGGAGNAAVIKKKYTVAKGASFRKNRQATAVRTAISFAGFTRESANVYFTQ